MHENWGNSMFCHMDKKWFPLKLKGILYLFWFVHSLLQYKQMLSKLYDLLCSYLDMVDTYILFHFLLLDSQLWNL